MHLKAKYSDSIKQEKLEYSEFISYSTHQSDFQDRLAIAHCSKHRIAFILQVILIIKIKVTHTFI